jgi:vancomycin resistance protein VanW
MHIRQFVPKTIRQQIRQYQRKMADRREGYTQRFACEIASQPSMPYSIPLVQDIKPSYLYENKIANIKRSSEEIGKVVIFPNEIFSFWETIGIPNAQNGYLKGRNIIAGQLSEDYGGGLCQVSSMLYHLALQAGMTIAERHNHSIDIYTPETRFTPLGSDATVAYGYKDLRLLNPFPFALRFDLQVIGHQFHAALWSEKPVPHHKIVFKVAEQDQQLEVLAINEVGVVVGRSCYFKG